MTTLAENKAIAGRWFDAFWGKRSDPGVIEELAGPNLVFQSAADQICRGSQEALAFMTKLREAVPDFHLSASEITAEREIVIVNWEGGGTHTGPAFGGLQVGPLPAGSGHLITVAGHSVIEVKEGRIAGEWAWSIKRQHQMRDTLLQRTGPLIDRGAEVVTPQRTRPTGIWRATDVGNRPDRSHCQESPGRRASRDDRYRNYSPRARKVGLTRYRPANE